MINNILETLRETNDKNMEDIRNKMDTLLHDNKESEKS